MRTAGPPASGDGAGGPERAGHPTPTMALIFSITVTGILSNTLIGPAIPDILRDLGQPSSRAGIIVAAATLPGIVVAPVIGILADRFGRRAVLVPCLVAFGVCGVAAAASPSFEFLVAMRLGQGVGSAGLINLAVVIIGDHWDGLERVRRVGHNAAVLTTSLALLPPVGGLLAELGGWRATFVPYGLSLVTAAAMWRRLDPTRPAQSVTVTEQLRGVSVAARQPVVAGSIAAGSIVFMLIFGLLLTILPVHLEEEFGLSAGLRGLVLGAPAVASTTTSIRLARLRARHGAGRLLLTSFLLFAASFAVVGAAGTLPVLLAGTLLFGFGEGAVIPTLQEVVTAASPPDQRGAVVALWVGAARAGQTIGPLAAGAATAAFTTGVTFGIGAVLAGGLAVAQVATRRRQRAGSPAATG